MNQRTILFAGGGTGGHVFPMIAVADAVQRRDPAARVVFVGTARGLETSVVPERGYTLELLEVVPMRGAGLTGALRGAAVAARAIPAARRLLEQYRPAAVFSLGGYAAGPISLAARLFSIPVALMEPNSAIGFANRLMAPLVNRAYVAFPESERYFRRSRVLQTGVPIRDGFQARPYRYQASNPLKLLVLGGSQGAQILNERVPKAVALSNHRFRVVHQAGRERAAAVRECYARLGFAAIAEVVPFIDDVAEALAASDLVIGRSGASAVAEICAIGRPSILVPYPHAGDHQRLNAESLRQSGAAVCLHPEPTAERLAAEMVRLTAEPRILPQMAARAASLGRPGAAHVIAADLLSLADVSRRRAGKPANAAGPPDDGPLACRGVA